jgi:hypothetical protein
MTTLIMKTTLIAEISGILQNIILRRVEHAVRRETFENFTKLPETTKYIVMIRGLETL